MGDFQVDERHFRRDDVLMNEPSVSTATLPSPIEGAHCWTGRAMTRQSWFRQVKEEEIKALERMVDQARAQVGDEPNALLDMTSEDFSLGVFADVVKDIEFDLRHGIGVSVIRTLPVHRWTPIETLIAYWGIGCQLGTPLSSNANGDMIGHVIDLGADYQQANTRGYDTNSKLSYHADQCDVVGLLCRQTAQQGGVSKLVSTAAVHNELLVRRPDLLAVLKEPLYFSWMGEQESGSEPWYRAPVFDFVDGTFNCAPGVNHIRKGHVLPGAPALTERQSEALTLFEQVCEELEFSMDFMPGDIQFLNNALIAHTRSEFTDWAQKDRRRHLLRIWLRVSTLHQGAAYFENWRDGVTPKNNHRHIWHLPKESS